MERLDLMEKLEQQSVETEEEIAARNIIPTAARRSLADNYLVEIVPWNKNSDDGDNVGLKETWNLTPLENFQNKNDKKYLAPGALATTALYQHDSSPWSSSSQQTTIPLESLLLEGCVVGFNEKEIHHHRDAVDESGHTNTNGNSRRRKMRIVIHAQHHHHQQQQSQIPDSSNTGTHSLLSTLSRIMVQRLVSQYYSHHLVLETNNATDDNNDEIEWHLQFLAGKNETHIIILNGVVADKKNKLSGATTGAGVFTDQDVLQLFALSTTSASAPAAAVELVEMVCSRGQPIGRLPRNLVHVFNILHRGIGLFVAKDCLPHPFQNIERREILRTLTAQQAEQQEAGTRPTTSLFPDLYVHRRTAWKRIFPSLYDMFVGGISLAGEDAVTTARREVAEELGLHRGESALSTPLLACTVCTSYNRCVVTLFCYVVDSTTETISWQEEEVAWGDFVPYSIIEAAADLSIQRLMESKTWPGNYPPTMLLRSSEGATTNTLPTSSGSSRHYDKGDWTTWDFVPDGLLVWEAWLKYLQDSTGVQE